MTTELVSAFTAGMDDVKTDFLALLVVIVPVALVLMGIMFVLLRGKRALKSISR